MARILQWVELTELPAQTSSFFWGFLFLSADILQKTLNMFKRGQNSSRNSSVALRNEDLLKGDSGSDVCMTNAQHSFSFDDKNMVCLSIQSLGITKKEVQSFITSCVCGLYCIYILVDLHQRLFVIFSAVCCKIGLELQCSHIFRQCEFQLKKRSVKTY